MKHLQGVLIICIVTTGLFTMWGCAVVGQDDIELRIDGDAREYPEVPDDYPFQVAWLLPEEEKLQIPQVIFENMVLLDRAQIKLWKNGDHDFVGAHLGDGIFFPKYPGVAYVYWNAHEKSDGTIDRYASRVIVSGLLRSDVIIDQLNSGESPEGVIIVDVEDVGIDIKEFLSK